MNFSQVATEDSHRAFTDSVRAFIAEHVTEDVLEHERQTGEMFNEQLHLALAAKGWITPTWPVEQGGAGLDAVRARILDLELARAQAPVAFLTVTRRIADSVASFASAELAAEILPRVADGTVRFCLGYTEPDGGSDIAAAKVRAIRDGDEWVINGSKIFTSAATSTQYVFLITRTDTDAPKHEGLTMFLVPLAAPGIEIQPVHTYGGERTNIVYYADVRISDRYRLGEINGGWSVLRGPLDKEHSFGADQKSAAFGDVSFGTNYARALGRALDAAVQWARTSVRPDGRHPADDPLVRQRLGQIAVDLQAALVTPGPMGRVLCSDVLVNGAADLMDLVGPTSVLHRDVPGTVGDGLIEFTHRYAQGTGTYGGTVEVFRAMIAQHDLKLPRPRYPGTKAFIKNANTIDQTIR